MKRLIFLVVIAAFMASCEQKQEEDRRVEDNITIQDYLTENNIDAIKLEDSGVYYVINEEGDNENFVTPTSVIRVYYKGYLIGNEDDPFDQRIEGTHDYLESFLGNLVFGWQVALLNFSKGAKGQIFIPSHAGYGEQERAGIPQNSVLIFDIHLVNSFE